MATLSMVSASSFLCNNNRATCSLALSAGSKRTFISLTAATGKFTRSGLLHCTFVPSSSLSLSSRSSFSGSLGLDFSSNHELGNGRVRRFVVRAGKPALCLTKRNRSRKSLARTHGFRRRMRTTSGRAVLKRRRAKGRKILCTKSYPSSGKAS